ncbi:hypothetical protein [Pseudomonas anguilliseptica]|uniref:hypothetical protein n=1 Tax=Pseudomonas anguilliseptica TaxID=53406 RepID=UPI0022AE5D43|nr:hypothetical protein [Pseudomonas anguilliseptica]MCZ4321520.1 hypothetical protein [Pseudomonas anguilliseptica]
MAYVLECIDSEIKQAVVRDAGGDKKISDLLSAAGRDNVFPDTLAVDHDRNFYLFSAPELVRSDSLDRYYLAFIDSKFYYFFSEGQSGNWFRFVPSSIPEKENIDSIVNEISLAFSVYGRWGSGPLSKRGKPVYSVVPKFREVASHGN